MNCWFVFPHATQKQRNDQKDNKYLLKKVQTPSSRILCSFASLKASLDAYILDSLDLDYSLSLDCILG